MSEPLEIVPLGGLGEVGMNCMTLACGQDMVILDCGVTFPGRDFGVNLIHPKLDWIVQNRDRVRAVLITHGHEDHIGAIPFLLRALQDGAPEGYELPPIYAPQYAIELMKKRLGEFPDLLEPSLRKTQRGQSFGVGCFEVEPYRVNHSIPESTGLILRTPAGVVVHSGDFKIEQDPPPGEPFDEERLRALAQDGVALLMSDSTNIDTAGDSGDEVEAAAALDVLIGQAKGRVVIAQFASNVYRMRAAMESARRHRRRVCLLGRSVENHATVARQLKHLRGFSDLLVSQDSARSIPRESLLVIATGTQGEKPAALSRLARGEHRALDLEAGDSVILSSRIIPGLEKLVYEMIDDLERRGVHVHHRKSDPEVHVSGHACRDELRALIDMVQPRSFLPVHGAFHHLRHHGALARECGVEDVLVVENGARLELNGRLERVGDAPSGRVHIDWNEPLDDQMLRDRMLMAELGFALVAVAFSGDRVISVEVEARGFLREDQEDLLDDAAEFVDRELKSKGRRYDGPDDVERGARRALKRFFGRELGRKPIVVSVAVEV